MAKWGNIWDGKFNNEVTRYHDISFCTTCMGRLYDLKKTLPKNIEDNKTYPNLEFVILDYNSDDNLWEWMAKDMLDHILSGRVSYYRTTEPKYYSMAHSRNIAFKVARGETVHNLDADNFTVFADTHPEECLASYINRLANECPSEVIFAKGKRKMHGRIGFYKDDFINVLGGYDEDLLGYGHDDHDLVQRAWAMGFSMYWWGGRYFNRINTSSMEKSKNTERAWKVTENENKIKSAANLEVKKFKANDGKHWGKATLIKNFNEITEI